MNQLTAREREVLGEIAQGKSNLAIAESLNLSKRAVEKHINAIFLKLGLADGENVSKRVQAVLMLLAEPGAAPPRPQRLRGADLRPIPAPLTASQSPMYISGWRLSHPGAQHYLTQMG